MSTVSSTEILSSRPALKAVVDVMPSQAFYIIRDIASHSKFGEETHKQQNLDANTDPLAAVVEWIEAHPDFKELISVAAPAESLIRGLSSFLALSQYPVVFHAEMHDDYGVISALRHSGYVFLQSFGAYDITQTAVAAYLTAKITGKPVVHFYHSSEGSAPFGLTLEELGAMLAEAVVPDAVETETSTDAAETTVGETKLDARAAALKALKITGLEPYEYRGPASATEALVILGHADDLTIAASGENVGSVWLRLYAPVLANELLAVLPAGVNAIALCEQIARPVTNWLPLFQDVLGADATTLAKLKNITSVQLGLVDTDIALEASAKIVAALRNEPGSIKHNLKVGKEIQPLQLTERQRANIAAASELEAAYVQVLQQQFEDLEIINSSSEPTIGSESTPEYGFGAFLAREKSQSAAVESLRERIAAGSSLGPELDSCVAQLCSGDRSKKLLQTINAGASQLDKESAALLSKATATSTKWIIGSDQWSYDLGNSGVHHVLASGKNINILIIDSTPQSKLRYDGQRKKDLGLYGMGFGNVYVASVAVYGSYTQLLQAFSEAEAFDGPSIVLGYLPYYKPTDDPLMVLKETKQAIETGYWPLYRWNPNLEDDDRFKLDSNTIKRSLQSFLDRENKLTMLARKSPQFARSLRASHGESVHAAQVKAAQDSYAALLDGLSGPPLLVLFASDGGQAESVGRRLARRAKGRGLKSTVMAMDDFEVDSLATAVNVVLVTSTAGQGEFPQNGRSFWEAFKSTEIDLSATKLAVFGMGDSLYWPRSEDKRYYNKPSHDLWNRAKLLGCQELAPLGQGDDQDADGWSTGYNDWEPLVWTALGVDGVAGADEPPPITNEDIKRESNYLRGTIAEGLQDKSTGAISANDQQLTKFHGIYMQDDRDVRDQRKADGLEPAYSFMVRVRLPGCVANPRQWLMMDELSDSRGNSTFKITTRGTFQLHGVIKEDLKPAIRGMNAVLLDTVAACGDVDRNVVASALPGNASVHRQILKISQQLSEHLLPRTTAYYEIWLEGQDEADKAGWSDAWEKVPRQFSKKPERTLVSQAPFEDHEPLYGPLYLPRKFKINIAVPPYNDVDVYGHDIGLITIIDETNRNVVGFNVLVGGGMGTTHNNKKTYPRTGSLIGFAPKEKILVVCEKIMLVQRDNGDRKNRKHARLKYTVDDMTVTGFKAEVEKYLGYSLEPARKHVPFETNVDTYGWVTDEEGRHHFTTFVENGRVEDTPELQFRSGFREIARYLDGSDAEFRLTANQHILISKLTDKQRKDVTPILAKYKLDNVSFSGLRLSSAACVAFPTCGLAMAESERYLPKLVTKVEEILEEFGLSRESIVMRMTGCPNGCARPWLAEVALVGKAYGTYNLMLGGGHHGERLNKLYRSSLKEDEILESLRPMFKAWALERNDGEPFGDFVIRKGIISEVREGKDWWDNTEPGIDVGA